MGGKHNKCCCRKGCIIAEDDFNRNASDLGSGWTHETGEWITVATGPWINGYAESQADDAIAIHNTPHRVPDESMQVYMDIFGEVNNSGDKYRVIVNAIDKDSYHFAEYIRMGVSDSILQLGISSSGTDTILKSEFITGLVDPVDEPRRMSCMIADNEFCASVSHCTQSIVFVEESVIPLGYYAGMGADQDCTISYWAFAEHAQTNPRCNHCLCNCETKYIPPILNAHLEGTGRMSGLSCDIELIWDRLNGNYRGNGTCCSQYWDLQLDCPTGISDFSPETAQLTVLEGCTASDTADTGPDYIGPGQRYGNDTSTCDPLSLVFGIFNVTSLDLACGCHDLPSIPYGDGTYTITVTE